MGQEEILKKFCKDKEYFSIVYSNKNRQFGKLIKQNEIKEINLNDNEIYTSIDFLNKDTLFYINLSSNRPGTIENPVKILINDLYAARQIEEIYPNMFNWRFNGKNIEAYARVRTGTLGIQGTITRYGGTSNFLKVIKFKLRNIVRMVNKRSVIFNFSKNLERLPHEILSTGSINFMTNNYCIPINLDWSWTKILNNSKQGKFIDFDYSYLDINYWKREVNPDVLTDTERVKIVNPLEYDLSFKMYPPCIQNLAKMRVKGDEGRYILIRYFLSIHRPNDAKFLVQHLITDKSEKEHINRGNSKGQFRTILNNIDRYKEISCTRLLPWCDKICKLVTPYEGLIKKEKEKGEIEQTRTGKRS